MEVAGFRKPYKEAKSILPKGTEKKKAAGAQLECFIGKSAARFLRRGAPRVHTASRDSHLGSWPPLKERQGPNLDDNP